MDTVGGLAALESYKSFTNAALDMNIPFPSRASFGSAQGATSPSDNLLELSHPAGGLALTK